MAIIPQVCSLFIANNPTWLACQAIKTQLFHDFDGRSTCSNCNCWLKLRITTGWIYVQWQWNRRKSQQKNQPSNQKCLADMRNNEINTIGCCFFPAPVLWYNCPTSLPTQSVEAILFPVSLPESKFEQIFFQANKHCNMSPIGKGNLTRSFLRVA